MAAVTDPATAPVLHPRIGPRRGAARASTWWGKAWVRAVEESAYAEAEQRRGRALARSGRVGQITIERGAVTASVDDDRDLWTARVELPVLGDASEALVEAVAAQAGRVGALLSGDLPHSLVEHADEAGAELLPFGGELSASCGCDAWLDPCAHALALLYQVTWLIENDPFVLLHLRGMPREELLMRLHQRSEAEAHRSTDDDADTQVDTALDAALRATRLLELLDSGESVEHLW